MAVKAKRVETNELEEEIENFEIVETKKKKEEPKKEIKKEAPKKKTEKKKKDKKPNIFKRIGNWFKEVVKEVSKVKFPTKEEMVKYSVATIVFVLFFALFFYGIDITMAFFKSLV